MKRVAAKNFHRRRLWVGFILLLTLVASLLVVCRLLVPQELFRQPYSRVLLDRDGHLLGASIAADQQWRFPPLEEVPEKFVKALLAYEDHRFYFHPGVDPLAILRALATNLKAGSIKSGASTITMQVMRLARGPGVRSYKAKIIEMALAMGLEIKYSKAEILALYAAHAPFGGNVVGLEAAAWRYFGRSPGRLSWAEAATLAVLPNSPAMIHPGKNRRLLRQKRDRLLGHLRAQAVIDGITYDLAKMEPLPEKPHALPRLAPHLLARTATEEPQGFKIRSTLKKELQIRATDIVRRHQRNLRRNKIHNLAALIADVNSGEVLAYVGNHIDPTGPNDQFGAQVDLITAPRSTGSILKPILYAAMMEAGELLPSQLVPDIPTRMAGFRPQNYTRTYQGAVPAHMALARSLNIPAVRMLQSYGVDRFYGDLKTLGMETLFRPAHDYGLSLILGGAEGRLWDIAAIYASMARCLNRENSAAGEISWEAPLFRPLTYRLGETGSLGDAVKKRRPVFDAAACWLAIKAMLEVARPGSDAAWRDFSSSRRIAWKTGTSYGLRDAWAIGITPGHVVGVWAGNAHGEGRPGLTGIAAAGPVLFDLFGLLDGSGWFRQPAEGLARVVLCGKSGYRRGPNCATERSAWIHHAGLRSGPCPYCRVIHLDATATFRVHGDCQAVAAMQPQQWFVLPPTMAAYYRVHHAGYRPLPEYRIDCTKLTGHATERPLSLINPSPQGLVYVPLELAGIRGRAVLEAAHRRPEATIFWHLNDRYLGATTEIHQMEVTPPPGEHKVTLVDEQGALVERRFSVLIR